MGVGPVAELEQRFLAELPPRDIDHARKGEGVLRVGDQTEVGEHVFDLSALVETRTANQAIGQAATDEHFLQRP